MVPILQTSVDTAFFCLIGFSFSFPLYAEQKVTVIKKDAELKTLPQVESLTIARLPLGGEFSIAEKISEEWIKISLPPDKGGNVQSGYVLVSFVGFFNVTEGPIKIRAGILPKYRSVGVQLAFGF